MQNNKWSNLKNFKIPFQTNLFYTCQTPSKRRTDGQTVRPSVSWMEFDTTQLHHSWSLYWQWRHSSSLKTNQSTCKLQKMSDLYNISASMLCDRRQWPAFTAKILIYDYAGWPQKVSLQRISKIILKPAGEAIFSKIRMQRITGDWNTSSW